MSTKRMLQLGEQIRDFIATMLVRGEIRDPRVKSVTIHSVKLTSDLQIAKVYFICSDKDYIVFSSLLLGISNTPNIDKTKVRRIGGGQMIHFSFKCYIKFDNYN
jgi:hypothetical protein